MNKCIFMGRLVADPELRYSTNTNIPVAKFRLAVNRPKMKDKEPEADFICFVAFGHQANFINKYCKKGNQVLIEGSLRNSNWIDDSGNKRYKTEIFVDTVEFAESKKESGHTAGVQATEALAVPEDGDGFYKVSSDDEDLPF